MITTLSNQGTELGLRPALIFFFYAHAEYSAWVFSGMPGMTICALAQANQMWCLIGDSKVQVLYGP